MDVVKDLLGSKKFIVLLAGVLLLVAKTIAPGLEDMSTAELISLIASYLVGQGIADHGKERALVQAAYKLSDGE